MKGMLSGGRLQGLIGVRGSSLLHDVRRRWDMPGGCDDSPMNGASDACNKRAAHLPGAFCSPTNTQIPPVNGSTISSSPS
jgi:hypothetical protein